MRLAPQLPLPLESLADAFAIGLLGSDFVRETAEADAAIACSDTPAGAAAGPSAVVDLAGGSLAGPPAPAATGSARGLRCSCGAVVFEACALGPSHAWSRGGRLRRGPLPQAAAVAVQTEPQRDNVGFLFHAAGAASQDNVGFLFSTVRDVGAAAGMPAPCTPWPRAQAPPRDLSPEKEVQGLTPASGSSWRAVDVPGAAAGLAQEMAAIAARCPPPSTSPDEARRLESLRRQWTRTLDDLLEERRAALDDGCDVDRFDEIEDDIQEAQRVLGEIDAGVSSQQILLYSL